MAAPPKPLNYFVSWTKDGVAHPLVFATGWRKGATRIFHTRKQAVTGLWQYRDIPEDASIHIHPTTDPVI